MTLPEMAALRELVALVREAHLVHLRFDGISIEMHPSGFASPQVATPKGEPSLTAEQILHWSSPDSIEPDGNNLGME